MHVDTGHNFPEVIEFRDRLVDAARRAADRRQRPGLDRHRAASSRRPDRGRRATGCRRRRCSTRSPSTASTPRSAAPAATRSAPAPRSACSRSATTSASGTPSASAPSCGRSTTAGSARASTCACSRSPTGPSSTSGSTSRQEKLEVPIIYFAHAREVFERDGMLYAHNEHIELIDGEVPFEESVRYRTVGDMTCTGAVRSTATTLDGGRRRDRRHPHHRARRDPRRRPRHRGRDGRPQARGLLLDAADARHGHATATPCATRTSRAAAVRDRRLGRRRQVDPDRAAAARLQVDLRGPARARRRDLRAPRRRLPEPGAADRRPARRARAGHHDRRRLPLLRRRPRRQVHHRRHPGPRAVHAQHGHRRLDRRPLDRPGRRAQGRHASRPAATPSSPRCCGSRTWSCASTRWTSSTTTRTSSTRSSSEFTDWAARLQHRRTSPSSRSPRCTATTSSTAPSGCPGTAARRCSTTSSTS